MSQDLSAGRAWLDLQREVCRLFNGTDPRFSRADDGAFVIDHWCDGDEAESDRVGKKCRKLIAAQRRYAEALTA